MAHRLHSARRLRYGCGERDQWGTRQGPHEGVGGGGGRGRRCL